MARDYSECTEKTGMGRGSMKNVLRNCERQGNNEEDAGEDPVKQRKGAFFAYDKGILKDRKMQC
jgi:hypothetical protein